MKRLLRGLVGGMLTAALVTVLAVTPAGAAGNGEPIERPYKERLLWREIDLGACGPGAAGTLVCGFTMVEELTGTHYGRAMGYGEGTVTLDLTSTCDRSDGLVGTPMMIAISGLIVAPDGSELFFSSPDSSVCFATFDAPLEGDGGNLRFTGGSGRFEGATGSAHVTNGIGVGTITY